MFKRIPVFAFTALLLASTVRAELRRLTPESDWFSVLSGSGLKPGDEVIFGKGVYTDRRKLTIAHRGTKEQPIVIRGEQGAILRRPDARQNTINMAGVQYVTLRDLEITGGETAIRIYKSGNQMAKFVTLEGLHIHHIGGVAVTCNNENNTYEGMVFRRNHIHHTASHGEGFYLGCNNAKDGSTPGYIFNSIIEGNYIHHLNGNKVSQGDGIEIKDGSYNNIIRDNVIHDTKYPGITVYGTDGKAPNIVEQNVIWNTGDNGIQAAADAIIRNNLVRGAGGDGIHCRTHQSAEPGNLRILHNTVIADGRGQHTFRVTLPGSGTFTGPVVIANNAFFASRNGLAMRLSGTDQITLAGNRGSGSVSGLKAIAGQWQPIGSREQHAAAFGFPTEGSGLIGVAAPEHAVPRDFYGGKRNAPFDVGAFQYGARGWKIQPGFKPSHTR